MKTTKTVGKTFVDDNERVARIVLSPRDIDECTGAPKANFISLRNNETGISFLRLDYMGEGAFMTRGFERADNYNKHSKKIQYEFVGWMEGLVSDIKALAPEIITITIDNPKENPEHICVEFHFQGDIVKGIVTNAVIMDIMDDLYHLLKFVII